VTLIWFVVWPISNVIGDQEPLLFNPVNWWMERCSARVVVAAPGYQVEVRVVRICHAGRDPSHRLRDRALVAAGVEVTYVVPQEWPEPAAERSLSEEPFPIVELPVTRAGDVNRHRFASAEAVARVVQQADPELVDLHEEPFSAVTHQLVEALPASRRVVVYASQNLDKRWPPPFAQWERRALARAHGVYAISRQAASVIRGKGYDGPLRLIPLGYDDTTLFAGEQAADDAEIRLALVGRLIPEKGVGDAVSVLARVNALRPARLLLVGEGPMLESALAAAAARGVADRVEHQPWQTADELARLYREVHVVLAPSRATATWTEQFGRMVSEGQASGCVVAGYASGAIAEVGGEAAALVPEGDVGALEAAVLRLIGDPREFAARREAGLLVSRTRTWDVVAREQLRFYEDALATSTDGLRRSRPGVLREEAAREFGPPARAVGTARPFALPLLRRSSALSHYLGRLIDLGASARAAFTARGR
jgi:glycosyltransferase involved in cell wall biosynthesis